MRITIAAVAGGGIIFAWGFVSHTVLPLGTMGLRPLPGEDRVFPVLRESVPQPGLYFFPGHELTKPLTEEEQKAYAEKYKAGPVGLLCYRPQGDEMMSPRQLITELVSNVLAAGVVAIVLSWVSGPYVWRVLAATSFGLVAWLSISVSYWNWYRFPGEFIAGEGIDQAVSWLLAGIVMAAIVRPRSVDMAP